LTLSLFFRQVHARQEEELRFVREMEEWEAKYESGEMDLPDPPAALVTQSTVMRNRRRHIFVAPVMGKLRICPVKDNVEVGGAQEHEFWTSHFVVQDTSK
jgi:hypothetical protein